MNKHKPYNTKATFFLILVGSQQATSINIEDYVRDMQGESN